MAYKSQKQDNEKWFGELLGWDKKYEGKGKINHWTVKVKASNDKAQKKDNWLFEFLGMNDNGKK